MDDAGGGREGGRKGGREGGLEARREPPSREQGPVAPTDENQICVLPLGRHRFGGPGHVTHVTGVDLRKHPSCHN